MQSETSEDMVEKEFSYSGRVDRFGTWNNNHPLHKAVVDHDHNGVHPMYFGEIRDKVHRKLFKGKEGCRSDGVQWWTDRMGVHLVLLAHGASFDEFVYVDSQAGPPEVVFEEGFGMELACMSESR